MPIRIPALTLLVVLSGSLSVARSTDNTPPAGTWKILLPSAGEESQASWIVRFEKKADAWTGTVIATADGVQRATVENVKVADGVTFTLKLPNFALPARVNLPTEKEPRMLGEVTVRGKAGPIVLEPTQATALDDFARAREVLDRSANTRETYKAALTLIALANERKVKPADLKTWAERAASVADTFGNDRRDALLNLAVFLVEVDGGADLAVGYAKRAEALVLASDPPVVTKRILRTLARALDRSGKEDDAKAVRVREEMIELIRLRPFAGKSKGFVLAEGFFCAQQPSCVGPALALDAFAKTYPDAEVYVLNHHLNLPGPDPLSNPATEERERYYRPRATPTVYFNGKPGPAGGGSLDEAQAKYDAYVAAIAPLLEKAAPRPTLTLKATRKGDSVEVAANLKDLAMPGEDVRLRLALVEEVVEYTGANGLPRHTNVVRDYFGTAAGFALPEKAYNRTVSVDIGELRQRLRAYLDKVNEATPFPNRIWPVELKKLRIVGFVQNDKTRELLTVTSIVVGSGE